MAKRTKADFSSVAVVDAGQQPEDSLAEISARADVGPAATPARLASDAWAPLLFMCSGAAGLIYQVVWTQDLVLVFGNTTQAIVTTVTAFLSGLGIGSLIGAAIGVRLRRALAVYGLLEAAVACLAVFMPLAFGAIATVFRGAYLSLPAGEVALIRFALAFAALTPVTLLMGMSLPVLTRHLVRSGPQVGARIAKLYGLNTLGAVLGAVASGYALIELLGLRGTTLVAVALNLAAAAGALLISRTLPKPDKTPLPAAERHRRVHGRQWLLLGVTFASGLVSLALEMLWTRLLVQRTGSPIYVFVAVLAVFLIGIGGGSLTYNRQRRAPQMVTLGLCLAGAALLTLVPVIVSDIKGPAGLPVAVALILPVTALLGYAFPLTVHLFVDGPAHASRGVGFVYAANTAGCVLGTVTAGFVLMPAIGTNAAIIALCIAEAAIGGGLAIAFAPRRRPLMAAGGLCVTAVIVLMNFVPAATHTYVQRLYASNRLPHAHFEDSVAMVDISGGAPLDRRLLINGTAITALSLDTKLLAYVPKSLRPNASSMLNICFGMGTTFRSSIILGMRTDAVELDPTVPTVMNRFYPDASRYLHSPLAHVIINDGRNYVRLTNKHYDLITIDAPPPVWSAGAVVLMTQEFYQEARQRLNGGGVLASFIPTSDQASQQMFIRTFRASFRHMMVLRGFAGLMMLGSQAPMNFHTSAITKTFGSAAALADIANAPDHRPIALKSWPSIIRQRVWLTDGQVDAYAGSGPLLTDDRPLSEYFLIRDLGHHSLSFERRAVQLALVVMCLVALLIVSVGLEAIWRAIWRRMRPLPGS